MNVHEEQDVEQPEAKKPRSFRWRWIEAVMDDPQVPMVDKLLAHTLATCWMDNDTGRCWPGTATIAARMSAGRRTVQEHLHGDRAALVIRGYLVIHEGVGRGNTHVYEATLPEKARLAHAKGADGAQKRGGSRARTGSRTGEGNSKEQLSARRAQARHTTPASQTINDDTHEELVALVGSLEDDENPERTLWVLESADRTPSRVLG